MRRLLFLLYVFVPFQVFSQQGDGVEKIMRFMGVTDPEMLDSYELERLSDFLSKPISVNKASLQDMEKSGLFTSFQVASIMDYRSRHGDILSFTELASLDGFGSEDMETLIPFITLTDAGTVDGCGRGESKIRQDASVRSGYRTDKPESYMYGFKYRLESPVVSFSASGSRPYLPSVISGNISLKHRYGKVIVGDFNARFGQGLSMWNTASIGGATTPSSFMKKPSGLSSTYSFTGTSALTGLAADLVSGYWKTSLILAAPGLKQMNERPEDLMLMPAFNILRYGRLGHVSVTHSLSLSDFFVSSFRIPQMKTSVDASLCLNGVNLFGEAVYDWVCETAGAVCGTDFMALENLRIATLLKYLPSNGFSNEHSMAVSGELRLRRWNANFYSDISYFPESKAKDGSCSMQVKAQTSWDYKVTENLELKLRLNGRYRTWGNNLRTDMRIDARYESEKFSAAVRINALKCIQIGLLGYIESGYSRKRFSAYMRAGAFRIDNWDDRIYVYERDAPGTFNVPAYYGRGLWAALNIIYMPFDWLKLYLRASKVSYIFMDTEKRKPGKAELKIQAVFRL